MKVFKTLKLLKTLVSLKDRRKREAYGLVEEYPQEVPHCFCECSKQARANEKLLGFILGRLIGEAEEILRC